MTALMQRQLDPPSETRTHLTPVPALRSPLTEPIVVFHERRLDEKHLLRLSFAGMRVQYERTATQAVRAALELRARFIVATLSGNSAERIASALAAADRHDVKVLCVADQVLPRHRQRAAAMGARGVLAWPDGIVEFVASQGASDAVGVSLRAEERVVLDEDLLCQSPSGPQGRMLNLSASGALVELHQPIDDAEYSFEFRLPGEPRVVSVEARVVRRMETPDGVRLALQFGTLAPDARERIREFVRQRSSIREPANAPASATAPSKRVTLRAQVAGGRRLDYFRLWDIDDDGLMLVQEAPFLPPYEPGTRLELLLWNPARPCRAIAVVERFAMHDDRPAWQLTFEPSIDATTDFVAQAKALLR